jgi:putative tricarboxylic transport membrane protein
VDLLSNLSLGFQTALTPTNLMFCFIGVTLGTLVGVLPGIGSLAAISMLLPVTFYLDPTTALIMLGGIFYGAQYGGSTASILLNLPGDSSSAVTCIDGYPMAKQGRAGVALFVCAIASFVGGSIAIVCVMLLTPTLASFALGFGSAEYFTVMLFGLVAASSLSAGSAIKGYAMVAIGLALGMVGTDVNSGQFRFTLGFFELSDGFDLVAIAMGLFGVSEILANLMHGERATIVRRDVTWRSLRPSKQDFRDSIAPTFRGSATGTMFGLLPGVGPTISSFLAYGLEQRVAKDPSRFGKGAIEGVAGPEAANNAAVQAAFIPTLSLGIPGNSVMAVMLGALIMHGITPGPNLVSQQPTLFWGLVASFWIGNVMLLILNIPMIGIWVRVLSIPYRVLYPSMLFFVCLGVYGVNNSIFQVYVLIVFGILGYGMIALQLPIAPLLLGFILGPLMEEHLRRAMQIGRGDLSIMFGTWISTAFLIATIFLIAFSIYTSLRNRALRGRLADADG